MPTEYFDDDDYINTAGMGACQHPIQAKTLSGISSQILRSLLITSPDDIPEAYGCSPEEAALALACSDLAQLPAWDEAALLDAATLGGNEEERVMWGLESRDRLARRISLAMKADIAPEVMSPAAGVLLLRRAGIEVFHQLLDAVAWLQLDSDATLPNYRLLMGIAKPQAATPPAPVVEAPASEPKAKRKSAFNEVMAYLQTVHRNGKFKTTGDFIRELGKQSGEVDSPFKKATRTDETFYLKSGGDSVSHSVISDRMKSIR